MFSGMRIVEELMGAAFTHRPQGRCSFLNQEGRGLRMESIDLDWINKVVVQEYFLQTIFFGD